MAKMRRTNYYYPVPLLERLKRAKQQTGVPVSEMIRRAIELYLDNLEKRRKP